MHMPLNLRSPLQQWILCGINGKKWLRLYFILYMSSALLMRSFLPSRKAGREWTAANCCILHIYFTLTLHTVVHEHKWRYHFWNGTGGFWRHLAWELMYFNSSGYKKSGLGPGAYVQNTFGNMLSFVSRTELVALGWKALHLFLSLQPEGNFISLQFFFQGHLSLNGLQKCQAKRLL